MLNPFKSMNNAMKRRQRNSDLDYLNGATDLLDLEYRERELDRRQHRARMVGFNQI